MNHPKLSVQLYTVREAIQSDLDGTLERLAAIGFSQVEPYNFADVDGLGAALAANGLTAPTGHAHFIGEDDAELDRVFSAAKTLGIDRVIDPHTVAERWQTADDIGAIADLLNSVVAAAASHGVSIGYHNHAHELQSIIDGRTALEHFVDRLDPAVALEIDTYWVAVGGQDPVRVLTDLGDRVVAIHIKDGPGTVETQDQVAVGSGSMPIRAIIDAAPNALRVVELDDSRGDRFDAVAASYDYLVKENLA